MEDQLLSHTAGELITHKGERIIRYLLAALLVLLATGSAAAFSGKAMPAPNQPMAVADPVTERLAGLVHRPFKPVLPPAERATLTHVRLAAASVPAVAPAAVSAPPSGGVLYGLASWYGPHFVGQHTADGELFSPAKLTAASKTLPFGTLLRVTNLVNGRHVVVRVNDRGPYVGTRILDLSEAAARRIGLIGRGVTRVEAQIVGGPS